MSKNKPNNVRVSRELLEAFKAYVEDSPNAIRVYRFKDLIDRLNSKEWKVHKRKGEEKYTFIPARFR